MTPYTIEGTLTPAEPFDFNQTLQFLGTFPPIVGQQSIADHSLTKAGRIEGQTIAFRVSSDGTIEQPRLSYTLFSDSPISPETAANYADRIAFYLSLNDDLQPFYALATDDPDFTAVVKQLYGYHQAKFLTPFEGACWALLSTRNRMSIARSLKARIMDRFGTSITIDDIKYPAFPEPSDLLGGASSELAEILSHMRRAEYIIGAAQAFATVDENWLRSGDYDEVQNWLRGIKGIGIWSASLVMIRALGRMDRLVAPEKNLVEAASRCYGRPLNEADVLKLAAHYENHQGYWAHYLRAAM